MLKDKCCKFLGYISKRKGYNICRYFTHLEMTFSLTKDQNNQSTSHLSTLKKLQGVFQRMKLDFFIGYLVKNKLLTHAMIHNMMK